MQKAVLLYRFFMCMLYKQEDVSECGLRLCIMRICRRSKQERIGDFYALCNWGFRFSLMCDIILKMYWFIVLISQIL